MDDKKISLTIYLLKADQVATFAQKLLGEQSGAVPLAEPLDGTFVPLPSQSGEPPWVSAIRSVLVTPDFTLINSQAPAGLLVVRRPGGTFVMSFGHAWQKLEDEWLERDFGRRVALNSIAKDRVLEIRAEQVFAKWHLASERSPRATSVKEFGVDFDRDLVAAVEGVPGDESLGKTIRGGTSLRVHLPFPELVSTLDKATELFSSNAYKKDWPEIDNVSPLKDQNLVAKLEAAMDTEFASGHALKTIALFTPGHKRDEVAMVDSYVFGRLSKSPVTRPYLTVGGWLDILSQKKASPSVTQAKETPVHLLDESKAELKRCTVFDCFGYELSLEGKQYILSSGVWYEIVSEFLTRTNDAVKRIPRPAVTLPNWNETDDEMAYNAKCSELGGLINCDRKLIFYGGRMSQFEFCDLVHMDKRTLFFAKIVSKSTGMSHLVEQVRRTSELLFSPDDSYRKNVLKMFSKYHPAANVSWLKSRPRHGDWNLCLVSLGKAKEDLPFFAKCGLVKLQRHLNERGHAMSFAKV